MDGIVLVQSLAGPSLDRLFVAVTWLGDPEFYSLVLPIIFWTAAPGFAFRLALLVLAAGWVVDTTKEALALPRPDPGMRRAFVDTDLGFAFPSGHALVAGAFWGFVAAQVRRPMAWIGAVLLTLMIGLSRVYLGVHWVGDVVGGTLLALVLLLLWLGLDRPVTSAVRDLPTPALIAVAALVSFALALLSLGTLGYQMAGAAGGFAAGYAVLRQQAPGYAAGLDARRAVLRVVIGVFVLVVLRVGLKALLPELGAADYFRYLLLGLWVALGPTLLVPGRSDREVELQPAATS